MASTQPRFGPEFVDHGDTIVGISSPPGGCWRGIVRLSGPDAFRFAGGVFHAGKSRSTIPPRAAGPSLMSAGGRWTALMGEVAGPYGTRAPARCLLMRAPRSYTREDVAELHTPGAAPLLDYLAERLVAIGARSADPGEFTLRAFLNGRIDLAQAEAVCAAIQASDMGAYRRAQRALAGRTGDRIRHVREEIVGLRVELEAELNWPDEEDVRGRPEREVLESIAGAREELTRLERPRADAVGGVRIVLVGRVNAGKSTIFNALVGRERALVHETPGTTTDAVTAELVLAGTPCTLVDTAGTGLVVGHIHAAAGQTRDDELGQADMVIGVLDLSGAARTAAEAELRAREGLSVIVGSKIDLLLPGDIAEHSRRLLPVSGRTGAGIEQLRHRLEREVGECAAVGGELVTVRQQDAVDQAIAALAGAARASGFPELCALELREAEEHLNAILGEGVEEDLLARIFTRFCIGK